MTVSTARPLQALITYRHPKTREPTPPLPGPARFHASSAHGKLLAGGYGGGKTAAGAVEALCTMLANPMADGLIVGPHWSTVVSVVRRTLIEHCPPGLTLVNHPAHEDRYLSTPWGSRIFYRSADNPASMDGLHVGWAWGDEVRYWSRDAHVVFVGRACLDMQDGGGPRWWYTTTPSMNWLHDEFRHGDPDRAVFKAPTDENVYNPPSYLEDLRRSYSERLQRQIIGGEFVLLTGAVYGEEFDEATHVVNWTYDPRLRTVLAWDPGKRAPYACLIQEITVPRLVQGSTTFFEGDAIVCDELCPDHLSTERLGGMVLALGRKIDAVYCDPAADATQSAAGFDDITAMRAAGLGNVEFRFVTDPRLRHIPTGVARVAARLRPAKGRPTLYFARSLRSGPWASSPRSILRALTTYRYPEQKDGRPVSDIPIKDGVSDHACDAVRYYVTNVDEAKVGYRQFVVR